MTRQPGPRAPRRSAPPVLLFLAALLALLPALSVLAPQGARAADGDPTVSLSKKEAGKGGEITVSGSGWRAEALLMLLICGQSTPERGVIGGTNACANADGRAVTTDEKGAFSKKLPVTEPPKPCPCVVHVATVTGEQALADAVFTVAGHPTADLPEQTGGGRLAVLATTRLEGDSSLLTWFGAPPARRLVFTVGNLGSAPVKDPVFEIGTAHGVYAPQWEERQWRGTVAPGAKARIKLPLELSAGAHGDYQVSLRYGRKVLAEQPWGVARPWGVTVFWVLLCLVVPAAVFRIGMAVVDKVRPRPAGAHRTRTPAARHRPERRGRTGVGRDAATAPGATTGATTSAATTPDATTAVLPWFTPDSAPSENRSRPTTKGQA
ncbi:MULTISPECIES: hypothetical protein [Streptomyces]|uniref:Neocarzinostatin family protein n=1 Tax=Streptomyces griseus subsp. griseus (strain JCM 4626 / CBS 651.72 / NBRC 13350 / KCC S-0626 / ISP 5235) TaxID=455632 RepID=B1VUS4_STRGG|nr:hypothetical protein [Streptomyces griseus]MBW3706953.1 hypothetical protein [Streptomyces griseus]BAG21300.1 conserved hypothetical protein [Streptomyces griseus subsp. griseus NBRC 13350]SEE68258.1 hypothetical protein SAMN04490359_5025 [Streptomyces griseus]SQA20904.1 Uncharacterised protein [Streptomyces griseus]